MKMAGLILLLMILSSSLLYSDVNALSSEDKERSPNIVVSENQPSFPLDFFHRLSLSLSFCLLTGPLLAPALFFFLKSLSWLMI